jgi:hypothetical protein
VANLVKGSGVCCNRRALWGKGRCLRLCFGSGRGGRKRSGTKDPWGSTWREEIGVVVV